MIEEIRQLATNHVEFKLNPIETQLFLSQIKYTTDTSGNTARKSYFNPPPIENVSFKEIISGPLNSKFIKTYSNVHYIKYNEASSNDGVWKIVLVCALDSPENLYRTDHNSIKTITAFISRMKDFNEMEIDEDESSKSSKLTTDISITIFNKSDYSGHHKTNPIIWESQTRTISLDIEAIWLVELLESQLGSSATIRFDIKSTQTFEFLKIFPFEKLPTEVYMTIINSLSILDISNLCTAIPNLSNNLTEKVVKKRLEILLSPYFPSISEFITILDKTGAIIGGSGILHILKPGDWIPSDIDIIVPLLGEITLIKFLESLGYVKDLKKSILGYGGRGQIGFKYHHFKNGSKRIDVCSTIYLTPGDFVLTYHSTPPMNYYDGHTLTSLFPSFTFNNLSVKNRFTLTDRLVHGLEKYQKRGYNLHPHHEYIQELPSLIFRKRRLVGYGNIIGLMSVEDQISVEMIRNRWEMKVDLVDEMVIKVDN